MKCIKNSDTGKIKRVSELEARVLVNTGEEDWKYCPKHEWKATLPNKKKEKN